MDDFDLDEPQYVEIGEEFGPSPEYKSAMEKQARLPKTPFQHAVIQLNPARTYFTKQEHKRVKAVERRLIGKEERIYRVFYFNCLKWAKEKNKKAKLIAINISALLTAMENKERYQEFKAKYGEEILRKKSATEVRQTLHNAGVSSMEELAMRRQMNDDD